jgi:hypothetical protein
MYTTELSVNEPNFTSFELVLNIIKGINRGTLAKFRKNLFVQERKY